MKRKFLKIFFNITTIFCLLSIFATNVYAATSEISDYNESIPAWISVISIVFVLVLTIGLLLFKLTKSGGYGVSPQDREVAESLLYRTELSRLQKL